jgi:hypothetical protein
MSEVRCSGMCACEKGQMTLVGSRSMWCNVCNGVAGSDSTVVTCVRDCVQRGWTCLTIACTRGHMRIAKLLCEFGGERLLTLTSDVSAVIIPSVFYLSFSPYASLLLDISVCPTRFQPSHHIFSQIHIFSMHVCTFF